MSSTPSNHLRLVRDDDFGTPSSIAIDSGASDGLSRGELPTMSDHVAGFWQTYTETTGWRIDPGQPDPQPMPAVLDGALSIQSAESLPVMSVSGAKKLAQAAARLAEQLSWQQDTLKRQQVELAARAAVISSDTQALSCHGVIERILSNATIATGTSAAAVYLLDDETEFLATRFLFGLAPEGRLGIQRPLRGSRADLEAMIQGVVAIDDLNLGPIDTWKSPEKCAAGICASIGGTDLPIGTLWLFSSHRLTSTPSHTASARIAAENIQQALASPDSHVASTQARERRVGTSAQVSPLLRSSSESSSLHASQNESGVSDPDVNTKIREIKGPSIQRAKARRLDSLLADVARWQHHTLPIGTRLATDWLVDGLIESPTVIAQSWHHWDVLPDGQIAIGICQSSMAGTGRLDMHDLLTTTLARAALQAHSGYRHQPADAVARVIDTLWQIDEHLIDDDGRPAISMLYAHIEPETGELVGASIGTWTNLIASRYGYRPLGDGNGGQRRSNVHPLDHPPNTLCTTLQPGEVWFVGGGSWLSTPMNRSKETRRGNQDAVGNAIVEVMKRDQRSPLAAVRRLIADQEVVTEMTAIGLQRA